MPLQHLFMPAKAVDVKMESQETSLSQRRKDRKGDSGFLDVLGGPFDYAQGRLWREEGWFVTRRSGKTGWCPVPFPASVVRGLPRQELEFVDPAETGGGLDLRNEAAFMDELGVPTCFHVLLQRTERYQVLLPRSRSRRSLIALDTPSAASASSRAADSPG